MTESAENSTPVGSAQRATGRELPATGSRKMSGATAERRIPSVDLNTASRQAAARASRQASLSNRCSDDAESLVRQEKTSGPGDEDVGSGGRREGADGGSRCRSRSRWNAADDSERESTGGHRGSISAAQASLRRDYRSDTETDTRPGASIADTQCGRGEALGSSREARGLGGSTKCHK
jgi:hypothetical protein